MRNKVFIEVEKLLQKVEENQMDNVHAAAKLVADSIMSGGILQAFGSGHSFCGAVEITGRAGGLIPAKNIKDPAMGKYEMLEGVGVQLSKSVEILENDVVVLISNSGRNPMGIELAQYVNRVGAKLIVVTALDASKSMTSRHSSGKLLYEFADVVLDNGVGFGDSSIEVEGLEDKVIGLSSISVATLLQAVILESIELMVAQGYKPPVYLSANIDGGPEHNEKLIEQYKHRIYRF